MASEILTTLQLKSIKEDDIGRILSDGGGLRGRVRKNRKCELYILFEYKYRSGSKWRTAKVGNFPDKSLADIRAIHRQFKTELSQGVDPINTRRDEKLANQLSQARAEEEKRQELIRLAKEKAECRTVSAAIEGWERFELKRRKDKGAEAMRAINKDVLPALGDIPLIDIKRALVMDVLFSVVERGAPVMANHLFSTLRQFFGFAIAREWIDRNPLDGITRDKIGGREQIRDRYLSQEEIVELKDALPHANLLPTTELSIWIMLATCCRVGEISKARWQDINFELNLWTIPTENSKNSRAHNVYLSDFTRSVFKKLYAITGHNEWCIPSRTGIGHIGSKVLSKQIRDRTREKALSNRTSATGSLLLSGGAWTPHDLRRTGATLMGELGVMSEVIEKCLNHVEQNKLIRTYQRHELKEEQKEAWVRLGDRISLLTSSSQQENISIVNFRK